MAWPKQLERFPLFTLDRLSTSPLVVECEGWISNSAPMPEAGRYVWLAMDLPDACYGNVISIDASTRRIVLHVEEHESLLVGRSYPLVDGYHNAYAVWRVLDEARRWTRTRFSPLNAIETPAAHGFRGLTPTGGRGGHSSRFYPPKEGDVPRSSGRIVAGGWDHEHCLLCMATISTDDEPEGYVDEEGIWVCCKCFETHVVRHDLGFIR
jgi:hypothetical protein